MVKRLTKTRNSQQSKERSIEDLIHPISETTIGGTTGLFYGKPSTGKTAFGSTWPKPILLLDIKEKGTQTIRNVAEIERIAVDTWEIYDRLYWWLAKKRRDYSTIMLDQITQLQDLAMAFVREEHNKDEDALITKQMWGQISGLMKSTILQYRDLREMGYNICFLAHERYTAGDDEAEDDQIDPSIGPRLMPSLSSFAGGAVDILGNTFIRETFEGPKKVRKVEYCMRIGPHGYYSTKIRIPIESKVEVPGVLVNPTFEKVMRISQGKKAVAPIVKKVKR